VSSCGTDGGPLIAGGGQAVWLGVGSVGAGVAVKTRHPVGDNVNENKTC